MEIQKYHQPTDGLTWVGARDTCVSKNSTTNISAEKYISQDSLRLAITNSSQILGQKSILRKIVSDSQSKNPIEIFQLSLSLKSRN